MTADERLQKAAAGHAFVREFLLREWDPIGVADIAEAQDEYDGYVGEVYAVLESRSGLEALVELLWVLETERMGLSGERLRTRAVAEKLERAFFVGDYVP